MQQSYLSQVSGEAALHELNHIDLVAPSLPLAGMKQEVAQLLSVVLGLGPRPRRKPKVVQ